MERHHIYAGIFLDETGQQLLNHSLAQLQSTLGTAWDACYTKENRLHVFSKCMDLIDTWNEKTFAEEAQFYAKQPRAVECWRSSFIAFVRQVYRDAKMQVRATVPNETAYVQALLNEGARHAAVRSGVFFTCDSSLEKKDITMDIIRLAISKLCDDFVLEEEEAPLEADITRSAYPDVLPDDSASQVGAQDDYPVLSRDNKPSGVVSQRDPDDTSNADTDGSNQSHQSRVSSATTMKTAKAVTIVTQADQVKAKHSDEQ